VSHSASATHGAVIGIGHRSIGPVSGLPCARKVALCAYSVGGVALRLPEAPRVFVDSKIAFLSAIRSGHV
jgi:hypothetical protein